MFAPPPPPHEHQVRGFEQDLQRMLPHGGEPRGSTNPTADCPTDPGRTVDQADPGIGKSFLMAKAAVEPLPETHNAEDRDRNEAIAAKTLVLAYRFKIRRRPLLD